MQGAGLILFNLSRSPNPASKPRRSKTCIIPEPLFSIPALWLFHHWVWGPGGLLLTSPWPLQFTPCFSLLSSAAFTLWSSLWTFTLDLHPVAFTLDPDSGPSLCDLHSGSSLCDLYSGPRLWTFTLWPSLWPSLYGLLSGTTNPCVSQQLTQKYPKNETSVSIACWWNENSVCLWEQTPRPMVAGHVV